MTGTIRASFTAKAPAPVFTTITTAEILPQYKLGFTIAETTILASAAAAAFGVYPCA
ncbi:MAG: hypothetical protein WBX22_02655 [Silvibacterium sp.]|jgi:hypothetical protein